MNVSCFISSAAAVAITGSLLAGCSSAGLPPATIASDSTHSWMAPDAATSSALLYVAAGYSNHVYVYSYPDGKLKGHLTAPGAASQGASPGSMCSDKAGNVYIGDGDLGTVTEFAHGGTKAIATFPAGAPLGFNCSIDPTTGRLAVAILGNSGSSVVVFTGTQRTVYPTPPDLLFMMACTYDRKGNLFCDGYSNVNWVRVFHLYELPAGSSATSLTEITVNDPKLTAGDMEWDGIDLAVSDNSSKIYRLHVKGTTANVVGTTSLNTNGASWLWQFCFNERASGVKARKHMVVIGPTYNPPLVGYWSYLGGGVSTKTITLNATSQAQPGGITLSVKSAGQ